MAIGLRGLSVAEVGDLVAHGRHEEDRGQQQTSQDGQWTSNGRKHGFSPYARLNNRTSDGTVASTVTECSSATAAPSPAARAFPARDTLPPRTCSHAARPVSISWTTV